MGRRLGVSLGLMLLSRSMVIAFLPALPLAAVWMLLVDRADRRRFANLGLGLAALLGTALLWYWTSWRPIFDYLLEFGYGTNEPGNDRSVFSRTFWTDEIVGTVDLSLYVPLAAVLLAGLLVAAAAWALSLHGSPSALDALRSQASRAIRSDAIVPLAVVVEGYLALSSSSNDGTGFVVPILPSFFALVVVAVLRVPWRAARVAVLAALCAVAVFDVVMKADVIEPISRAHDAHLPLWGKATLVNGRGFFHQHLVNDACYELGPPREWLPKSERDWLVVFRDAVAPLKQLTREEGRTLVALREPVLNASAIRLAALREGIEGGTYDYVDTGGRDSVDAYRELLSARRPHLVLIANRKGCGFGPPPSQQLVARGAASLGYRILRRLPLPDGRELQVWAAGGPSGIFGRRS